MGSYELDKNALKLHYTGDGWQSVSVSRLEAELFEANIITGFQLFNDGREVE